MGTVQINQVTPQYFQQLVAESRGRSYLGQGA
jgi:glucose-6-phosphate isomerase